MSFFSLKQATIKYGVIIDVGSGSVLTAIVESDTKKTYPKIIWSHREHAPLKKIDSIEQSAKAVMTALVNASMLLESEGRKALMQHNKDAELKELQCSVSAPWSYTVTKTINYKQEETFVITEEMITELSKTIERNITEDLEQNQELKDLGLSVVSELTMNLSANGYRVKDPIDNKANTVSLSQASTVVQKYLIDAIDELKDKLFPKTSNHKISFVVVLYSMTRELLNNTHDVCLVDITYEATEIGIVRDGILTYCTHTPFGSFSIAREIAEITNVPLYEAFGYLHTETPYAFVKKLNKSQQEDMEAMFESYIEKVKDLFHETGDSLSIPNKISLHSDLKSETLFMDLIKKAAKRATKSEPYITRISTEIIEKSYLSDSAEETPAVPTDTALLLSAQFFHTQPYHKAFKHF